MRSSCDDLRARSTRSCSAVDKRCFGTAAPIDTGAGAEAEEPNARRAAFCCSGANGANGPGFDCGGVTPPQLPKEGEDEEEEKEEP